MSVAVPYPAPLPAPTVPPVGAPRVRPVPRSTVPARVIRAGSPAHRRAPELAERIVVLRTADTDEAPDELTAPAPPSTDPTLLARVLAGALVEVALGSRPVGQLARRLAPGVLADLRERACLSRAAPHLHHAPVVRQLLVCRLDRAVEVAAVVDDSRRTRAVALRLEPHRTTWRATAVEIG